MHPLTIYAVAVVAIGWILYQFGQALGKRNAKYNPQGLPGPTLIPWVGRIHDLPIDYMWLKFYEWGQKYGPIYRTKMLGANFIIISDEDLCDEILTKKAKIYSDRPEIKSLFDAKSTYGSMEYLPLMGRNSKLSVSSVILASNTPSEYWARQRKFTHSYLMESTNKRYYGIMELEAKRWMYRLLNNPDDFGSSLEDMASKVMCQLTWDDPNVSEQLTPSAWGLLTQMSPAGPITNVLTPLWDWLPHMINPWKIAERKRHDEQQAWFMERLVSTRKRLEKGKQRLCYGLGRSLHRRWTAVLLPCIYDSPP
jgi:cytochrome P450